MATKLVIESMILLVLLVNLSPSEGETPQTWCGLATLMITGAGKTGEIPNIDKAAVLGADGTAWTTEDCADKVLTINETEAAAILKKDADALRQKGLYIEGVRYMVLQASDKEILGKRGRAAVYVRFTIQAALVGRMPEEGTVEKLKSSVGAMADYLVSTGY